MALPASSLTHSNTARELYEGMPYEKKSCLLTRIFRICKRLLGAAASFLVLNAAAWLAFWVWIGGRAGRSWHKVQYQEPAQDA